MGCYKAEGKKRRKEISKEECDFVTKQSKDNVLISNSGPYRVMLKVGTFY